MSAVDVLRLAAACAECGVPQREVDEALAAVAELVDAVHAERIARAKDGNINEWMAADRRVLAALARMEGAK